MQKLICTHQNLPENLANGIFVDRRRQFVERLQWDLCLTPSGQEIDEYDNSDSTYLVVHRNGKHMGSCRVRPTDCSTMITDHFQDSFPDATNFLRMQKGRMYELTRFCRSPDISKEQSKTMMHEICRLMDDFKSRKKLSGFIAVVFPKVARFMDTIGMRYVLLAKSSVNGQCTYMICITQASSEKAYVADHVSASSAKSASEMIAA